MLEGIKGPLVESIKRPLEFADSFQTALIENSSDAILGLSVEGEILTINRAAEKMFGYRREEVIGRSVFQLVPLGRGGDLQGKMQRVKAGEILDPYEAPRIRKDGTIFYVSLRLSVIRNEDEVIGFSWIARDISRERENEKQIKILSSVVEQTADSVMITNRNGMIEYVNPSFCKTTGYSASEVLGKSSRILKSGKHPEPFYKSMWATILSGSPFQATMINRKKNGDLYYTEKTVTPLAGIGSGITHFVSTDKDITARKEAEEKAAEVQQRFSELFNHSADPMAYCDLDGTIISVNEAFCRFTKFDRGELEGIRKYQDITSDKYWQLGNKLLAKMLKTGEAYSYEKEYLRKDGIAVPALVTVFPLRRGDGEVITGIGSIVKDMTKLKEQQKQLESAMAALRQSNSELEQFAYAASHDLKEPLRTISSYLKLIERRNPGLDSDSREFIGFALDASERLRNLIQDLLLYAQVGDRSGTLDFIDCNSSVEDSVRDLGSEFTESKAILEIPDKLPSIFFSQTGLHHVFQNLISNAVKYRSLQEPRVKILARRMEGCWQFEVCDNGIGIAKEDQTRIFAMFQRLHGPSEYPGTGIGLAICKKVVQRRGGKIWVESEEGVGSSFYFTVPDEVPAKIPPCLSK